MDLCHGLVTTGGEAVSNAACCWLCCREGHAPRQQATAPRVCELESSNVGSPLIAELVGMERRRHAQINNAIT